MIKAITFDFWQTLYADLPELNQKRQELRTTRCHKFLVERGYSCTLTQVDAGFKAAYNFVSEMWHQHRGVAVEACMLRFAETLQIDLDQSDVECLVTLVGESFLDTPPVFMPFAKEVLDRLRAKYRLAIISDAGLTPGRFLRRLMERDGVLHYFSPQTFSDETHHTKPEVAQFHSTLSQLKVGPAEAVHIGDIVRTDIVGAKNAGMRAIRFSGVNRTEQIDGLSDAVIDDYRQLETVIAQL